MDPRHRSYVTSRYRVVCQCFVQLKFRVSEKFTKNWCNLPHDFVISKLWCRFLWPSQNIWTLRIRNKIWILVLIWNKQSSCLRSGLEYIFGFQFQTAHYFTLVSNFTPNRYGKGNSNNTKAKSSHCYVLPSHLKPVQSINQSTSPRYNIFQTDAESFLPWKGFNLKSKFFCRSLEICQDSSKRWRLLS